MRWDVKRSAEYMTVELRGCRSELILPPRKRERFYCSFIALIISNKWTNNLVNPEQNELLFSCCQASWKIICHILLIWLPEGLSFVGKSIFSERGMKGSINKKKKNKNPLWLYEGSLEASVKYLRSEEAALKKMFMVIINGHLPKAVCSLAFGKMIISETRVLLGVYVLCTYMYGSSPTCACAPRPPL